MYVQVLDPGVPVQDSPLAKSHSPRISKHEMLFNFLFSEFKTN